MFKSLNTIKLALFILLLSSTLSFAGENSDPFFETDALGNGVLTGFFDLRDRESFIQVSNVGSAPLNLHVQLFNVNNDCNENNFFDIYTPNDTHIYNLRDILTNDTNPAGVVLPSDAYGIIVVSTLGVQNPDTIIGNLRVLDIAGYEYRTNLQAAGRLIPFQGLPPDMSINYNTQGGTSVSDVIGIVLSNEDGEFSAADVTNNNIILDVDIYDLNETPFSCRDIVFACVNENNPRLEELLEFTGVSVASFEYGINDAIPNSKGGELLCPGNNISDGFVNFTVEELNGDFFRGFIGLTDANGRGTVDSFWYQNPLALPMEG